MTPDETRLFEEMIAFVRAKQHVDLLTLHDWKARIAKIDAEKAGRVSATTELLQVLKGNDRMIEL